MSEMLKTCKITKRVERRLLDKKSDSISYYMGYLDWLRWMKDEVAFKKFQMMLEKMLDNWLLKPKEKADLITFFYPQFEKKVDEVKQTMAKKNKKLNFECKPMMAMIWGC